MSMSKDAVCYLLLSPGTGRTYIGVTTKRCRRLRQHNGEIVGGAKYTRRGRPWIMVCCVNGFPEYRNALQFEWAWKYERRRRRSRRLNQYGQSPVLGRLNDLATLMARERWTSRSPLAATIQLHLQPLDLRIEPRALERLNRLQDEWPERDEGRALVVVPALEGGGDDDAVDPLPGDSRGNATASMRPSTGNDPVEVAEADGQANAVEGVDGPKSGHMIVQGPDKCLV